MSADSYMRSHRSHRSFTMKITKGAAIAGLAVKRGATAVMAVGGESRKRGTNGPIKTWWRKIDAVCR